MIVFAYLCIIIGVFVFYIGWKARSGLVSLATLKSARPEKKAKMWRYTGNNLMTLGVVGWIAGVAQILMGVDIVLVFLAYVAFIVALVAMLRYAMNEEDSGPQRK
ncbi:MAG: hypothetical protein WCK39_10700 [Methanomassiliicoccales archaeon]